MNREEEEKIGRLQLIEQNLQSLLMQKQTFQTQLYEIENALKEIATTKENAYKIIGPVMIAADKKNLKKELEEKKDITELRMKTVEKQEKEIKKELMKLQEEIVKKIKGQNEQPQ